VFCIIKRVKSILTSRKPAEGHSSSVRWNSSYDELMTASKGGKVFGFLWVPGGPPCERAKPHVEQIAQAFPQLAVHAVSIHKNPEAIDAFNIDRAPTFVILDRKRVVAMTDRPLNSKTMNQWVHKNLG
jgi:thiol-disulfide isomerase/thioredoxin